MHALIRLTLAGALAGFAASAIHQAHAADTCKECSDHRKRCMANYPGPTCKTDYDICMKTCSKK